MSADWSEYQEQAAEFFRSLGMEAITNFRVNGARTCHDVDVLVKSRHAGFDFTWVVECKHWKSQVSKLHVLGLRQIVVDPGADRGILLAENGFQIGATEAAALTNVHLASLSKCRDEASAEVFSMRLRDLFDRIEACRVRYWDISKLVRIEQGLRPDTLESGYSGAAVISFTEDVLRKAFRRKYPFETDFMWIAGVNRKQVTINTIREAVELLERLKS